MSEFKIVGYGGGVNSTALLIECVKRKIKVDLIIFSDTGGERPHTYAYVEMFSKWLLNNGMPKITIVKKVDFKGDLLTLEQDCLNKKMLPSIAYGGYKSCSQKYKIQPQDKFVNNYPAAKKHWAATGKKITKLVGYDADEAHRSFKNYDDKKYIVKYPLVEWDYGRDECIKIIEESGLCQPGKSACYFCPNSSDTEIRQLNVVYPELAKRCIQMEENADLHTIKGLGRNFKWGDLLKNPEMFPDGFSHTPEMLCECYDG